MLRLAYYVSRADALAKVDKRAFVSERQRLAVKREVSNIAASDGVDVHYHRSSRTAKVEVYQGGRGRGGGIHVRVVDENGAIIAEGVPLSRALRLEPEERATAARLRRVIKQRVYESRHEGSDFIEAVGRHYDALGQPGAATAWDAARFWASRRHHLTKSNHVSVLDVTGFSAAMKKDVEGMLATLTPAENARILRVGF